MKNQWLFVVVCSLCYCFRISSSDISNPFFSIKEDLWKKHLREKAVVKLRAGVAPIRILPSLSIRSERMSAPTDNISEVTVEKGIEAFQWGRISRATTKGATAYLESFLETVIVFFFISLVLKFDALKIQSQPLGRVFNWFKISSLNSIDWANFSATYAVRYLQ